MQHEFKVTPIDSESLFLSGLGEQEKKLMHEVSNIRTTS